MKKKTPQAAAEIFPVPIILADGSTIQGEFLLYEINRLCRLDLSFGDRLITHTARDFFEALLLIRQELDAAGIRVVCYGACPDVRPSGTSRSMSRGVKAARRVLGQKNAEEDLHILGTGPDANPVTISEQNAFYDEWLQSVGREKTPKLSIPVKYRRRKTNPRIFYIALGIILLVGGIAFAYKKFHSAPPPITPSSIHKK